MVNWAYGFLIKNERELNKDETWDECCRQGSAIIKHLDTERYSAAEGQPQPSVLIAVKITLNNDV